MKAHSVWFVRDVPRIYFVVIFFQWTQNWTALNFEVNFQPLIQPYSSRLFFFFSTRPAANTTSYLYILEYTGVLMVFHRLGKPSALWTSVGHV